MRLEKPSLGTLDSVRYWRRDEVVPDRRLGLAVAVLALSAASARLVGPTILLVGSGADGAVKKKLEVALLAGMFCPFSKR